MMRRAQAIQRHSWDASAVKVRGMPRYRSMSIYLAVDGRDVVSRSTPRCSRAYVETEDAVHWVVVWKGTTI